MFVNGSELKRYAIILGMVFVIAAVLSIIWNVQYLYTAASSVPILSALRGWSLFAEVGRVSTMLILNKALVTSVGQT